MTVIETQTQLSWKQRKREHEDSFKDPDTDYTPYISVAMPWMKMEMEFGEIFFKLEFYYLYPLSNFICYS